MNLIKYITGEPLRSVANAGDIGASRSILEAVNKYRDQLRDDTERSPRRDNNNLKNDLIFKLGQINFANQILDLPRKARERIEKSEGD